MTLEDRIKKLEAANAYRDRQDKRLRDALRSAAGQLANIPAGASLADVIQALKAAAGQLLGITERDK
jgi:histidinol-phosphate/aromatic aminotransferase/cobyric acid decarboxylase-like protein